MTYPDALVAAWRAFSDRFMDPGYRNDPKGTPIRDAFAAGWDAARQPLPDSDLAGLHESVRSLFFDVNLSVDETIDAIVSLARGVSVAPTRNLRDEVRRLTEENALLRVTLPALDAERSGAALIGAERRRQIETEGYTAEHDAGEAEALASAAACYARGNDQNFMDDGTPDEWPWDRAAWKPKDRLRDLVRAGALIAAAIDALEARS